MSRQEFDVAANAQGSVNVEAEIQAPSQPAQQTGTLPPATPEQRTAEQPTPQQGVRAYVQWSGGSGSARKEALDNAAANLSAQIKVDYDIVREQLENVVSEEGIELSEDLAQGKKAQRRQISIGLDDAAVQNAKDAQHQRNQTKSAVEARTKVYEEYGELPSVAQLLALQDEGIKTFKGKPIDEVIQAERNAFTKAEDELGTEAGYKSGRGFEDGSDIVINNPQKRRFSQEEIIDVIKQHGSFAEREGYQKQIEEKYRYRPLAFPIEAAKNFGSYIAKLPAKAIQASMVATEATGHTALIEAVTGQDLKPSENPVWQWAESFQNSVDELRTKSYKTIPTHMFRSSLPMKGQRHLHNLQHRSSLRRFRAACL